MTIKEILEPHKNADKAWYLSLLDGEAQTEYEEEHLAALLKMLKVLYVSKYLNQIKGAREEREKLRSSSDFSAADYAKFLEIGSKIEEWNARLQSYKCFFSEPYFARIDVTDPQEGYNSYYIGKRGDLGLEIVDWRAPLAVRYYQKSRVKFSIGEYEYSTVLRRAISVKNGKLLDFKNEYLSVKDVLSEEEIAGRDEEILFDPYLRDIIKSRKEDTGIRDIIRTIQEQQFDIITRPEREDFVLQGCAGSGKTMILLHRLSYLMYNNEQLRPRDILVITPSDSFNAFIDELSQALELQRVKTTTLSGYFFQALAAQGIDLLPKLSQEKESEEYLRYVYSPRFVSDMKKRVAKLYAGVSGLFVSEECRSYAAKLLFDCRERQEKYTRIKNASLRIRRAVLGEMKDDGKGGFYFTKPFRLVMSAFTQAEDFLSYVLEESLRSPDYFFRVFVEFYSSARTIAKSAAGTFSNAVTDLETLIGTIDKEIIDLKRYRIRKADGEVLTYAERIARREELRAEALRCINTLHEMERGLDLFSEFTAIIRSTSVCNELGRCKDDVDISRWLYRETVKRAKTKYSVKGIFPSDGYALLMVLAETGRKITPRYGLVFVDEGQDISEGEYALLKRIHSNAAFNVFGDLKQNITPWRGVKSWECLNCNEYTLSQNYRNTNEIVEYVSGILDVDMRSIGLHGEPVKKIKRSRLAGFFREKQGLKAVIAKEEYLPLFERRGFRLLSAGKSLTNKKVNVMSVFESKGLEFSVVAVYDKGMTENEKYIAYTRALSELVIVED